jgi:hypothetical protein
MSDGAISLRSLGGFIGCFDGRLGSVELTKCNYQANEGQGEAHN